MVTAEASGTGDGGRKRKQPGGAAAAAMPDPDAAASAASAEDHSRWNIAQRSARAAAGALEAICSGSKTHPWALYADIWCGDATTCYSARSHHVMSLLFPCETGVLTHTFLSRWPRFLNRASVQPHFAKVGASPHVMFAMLEAACAAAAGEQPKGTGSEGTGDRGSGPPPDTAAGLADMAADYLAHVAADRAAPPAPALTLLTRSPVRAYRGWDFSQRLLKPRDV